jgi:hypothetical protein
LKSLYESATHDSLVIVNGDPLLFRLPARTTTLPVDAPAGTRTMMLVADQLRTVAPIPLKLTVGARVVPNDVPVIVTGAPTEPCVLDSEVIDGDPMTVNGDPLLARPPTVTTTLPVVAPDGTGTTIDVDDQLEGVAVVPLNLTVLDPLLDPNPVPLIVTGVLADPAVGESEVMVGDTATVNWTPLLASPPTVTTTLPVVAPGGTGTTMLVADQLVGVAVVLLNLTVLDPMVDPNDVPVIVTDVPA